MMNFTSPGRTMQVLQPPFSSTAGHLHDSLAWWAYSKSYLGKSFASFRYAVSLTTKTQTKNLNDWKTP